MCYFSYCEDEALKVKISGLSVHRFFSPESFIMWGFEPKIRNYEGYAQIVDLPIDTFLGLAEPIPEDDLKRHSSMEDFENDVRSGKPTNWEVPYLVVQENEDGIWKVIGHDGRHRGMLLKHLGYVTMPVLIKIPKTELNEELLPEILWCQNDKSVERERDFYGFPINEFNINKPYAEACMGIMTVGNGENSTSIALDEASYGKGCDAPNLKEYLGSVQDSMSGGKAPDSCLKAKSNFGKNFVPNVAYRKDNTMPAATLGEYLKKKSK